MKKTILVLLVSLFVVACGNNKKVEKVEKVESDPVTVQLTVVNNTGKELPTHATWGVDVKDVKYTIPVGETYVMKSNTHSASGTVFANSFQSAGGNVLFNLNLLKIKKELVFVIHQMEMLNKLMVTGVMLLILLVILIVIKATQPQKPIMKGNIGNLKWILKIKATQ